MTSYNKLLTAVHNSPARGAWKRGVREYAVELMENIRHNAEYLSNERLLQRGLLNGASSWEEYSFGACALIFDVDIAERLCSPSAFKRARGQGQMQMRRPNAHETWLDVQARALCQAYALIRRCLRKTEEEQ